MEQFSIEEKDYLRQIEGYYRLQTDEHLEICEAAARDRLNFLEWNIGGWLNIPIAKATLEIIVTIRESRKNGV